MKMKAGNKKIGLAGGLLLVGCLLSVAAAAYFALPSQESAPPLKARLNEVSGDVKVRVKQDVDLVAAENGMLIKAGGGLVTGADGWARIDISDGTIIRVVRNSSFSLKSAQTFNGSSLTRLKLQFGEIWVILNGGTLEIDSPSGVASVRGSYMSLKYDPINNEAFLTCLEGICEMAAAGGSITMRAGQTATVTNFSDVPIPGVMDDSMVELWLLVNPEAKVILPAVTATVAASQNQVVLPNLACLQTGTCQTYCAPPGWNPASGQPPNIKDVPQDCVDAGNALVAQGVDPRTFLGCVVVGGDPQMCADNAVKP